VAPQIIAGREPTSTAFRAHHTRKTAALLIRTEHRSDDANDPCGVQTLRRRNTRQERYTPYHIHLFSHSRSNKPPTE